MSFLFNPSEHTPGCTPCYCVLNQAEHENTSKNPVRYFNGEINFEETDISFTGFGMPWGQTRSYDNIYSADYDGVAGINWYVSQLPFLTGNGGPIPAQVSVVLTPNSALEFLRVGATNNYEPLFYQKSTLTYNPTLNQYVYLDPQGRTTLFYGFGGPKAGLVQALVDPYGNMIPVNYDSNNRVISVAQYYDGTVTGLFYTWQPGQTSPGKLATVKLTIKGVDQRRVTYSYYGVGESGGLIWDLKKALVEEYNAGTSSWAEIGSSYYRYYTDSTSGGFKHGLKYLVGREAYAQMVAAGLDPATATDSQVAGYADYYFVYDSSRRVVEEQTQGGKYTYGYAYVLNPAGSADFNQWVVKTTETLPDSSVNIVYTNPYGQALCKVYQSGTAQWYKWFQYDGNGNLLQRAESSGVSGVDESLPSVAVLKANAGLFWVSEYYAAGNTLGQPAGYQRYSKVKEGLNGTPSLLKEWLYDTQTLSGGGSSIYVVGQEIVYQSTTGSLSPAVTEYDYRWFSGTFQLQQKTTNWPVVATTQNGSGAGTSRSEVYNTYGSVIWQRDERGYLTAYTNDPVTGALTQQIDDVDTSILPAPSFTGWTTPAGGGLHLITDYEFDAFGRQTQSLGPVHTVDIGGTATSIRTAQWTVYQDALHQVWTGNGYATGTPPSYIYTLVNPVRIRKTDYAGRVTDQIKALRASASGRLSASDSFPQSSWIRWSSTGYEEVSSPRIAWQRLYFAIPSSGSGTAGINYLETNYGYDNRGRQIQLVGPAGTITRQVLNGLGWTLSSWMGTNDTGATASDPTGGGATGNNMVKLNDSTYDGGSAGGNGNRTLVTNYASVSDTRQTSYGYDFRNRLTSTDGEIDFYETYTVDNLDRVVQTDQRNTSSTGTLVKRAQVAFDDRGRIYKQVRYAVNPQSGAVGNALNALTWYDPTGNVMKQQGLESRQFTKSTYDGLNRKTMDFVACDPNPETYAQAGSVNDDIVLQQIEISYDAASNGIFQVVRERNDNATGNGALNGPTGTQPQARVSYAAFYLDEIGRMVATANYGTNGGTVVTRSATIPTPSDTILVSFSAYNNRGELTDATDPQGTVTRKVFDDAGRAAEIIDNYQSSGSGVDVNKTTQYVYALNGQYATMTCVNASTGNQVTQWIYGTTLTDSGVASNELLAKKVYPDGSSDQLTYRYNTLGQVTSQTDQNGTMHTLEYDKLGRQIHDRVTTLGSGINGAIRRISRSYEVRGMVQSVTSYDTAMVGSGSVVNDVLLNYSDFGKLSADYQAHSGAVNSASSPVVKYTYHNGSNNTARLETIVYPTSRTLGYYYGATNSIDDLCDRVGGLGGSLSADLVAYTRRGVASTVRIQYLDPGIEMTYLQQAGQPVGDGGDRYTGLDRFGRIVDIRWMNSSSLVDLERIKYGFSRASNRLWRNNTVAPAGFGEQYVYDGLYQIDERKRGTFSSGVITGTPVEEEDFTYDPTGNWSNYETRANGTVTLNQSRTHNQINETTQIAGSAATVGYDGAGNMTRMPTVENWGVAQTLVWDAWNRLISVSQGGTALGTYQYDGLQRRVTKISREYSENVSRDYYYSNQWQILEEHADGEMDRQFVWGVRYVDDLVLRERYGTDPGSGGGISDTLYALHDQWSVTAIASTAGTVQERYIYQAFGDDDGIYSGTFVSRNESYYAWETRYGAYRYDLESSLYQVRFRFLQPSLGRWLSRDPIEERGGNNLYAYILNNPENGADFLGLACCDAEKRAEEAAEKALENLINQEKNLENQVNQAQAAFDAAEDKLIAAGIACVATCAGAGELAPFACAACLYLVNGYRQTAAELKDALDKLKSQLENLQNQVDQAWDAYRAAESAYGTCVGL